MKILIAGSRSITGGPEVLDSVLDLFGIDRASISLVVHGSTKGADTIGKLWAEKNHVPHTGDKYKINWKKNGLYNRGAGNELNNLLVEVCDLAVVLWDGKSSGTRNLIKQLIKSNKKYYVHTQS